MPGRVAIAFLISFNVALGILVLYMLSRGYQPPKVEAGIAQTIEYKDFISILLTGLAVMIAVATILVAAGAIWGFEFLRKETTQTAEREARTVAERTARSVAEAVATRTARATPLAETTEAEADELAGALGAQDGSNG